MLAWPACASESKPTPVSNTGSGSAVAPAPAKMTRTSDGHCEPMPKEGSACTNESWCVLDWGQPGGHSSALWCRGGKWVLEEEVNER